MCVCVCGEGYQSHLGNGFKPYTHWKKSPRFVVLKSNPESAASAYSTLCGVIWNSFRFLLYSCSLFLENYCTWLLRYGIFVWGGALEISLLRLSYLSVYFLCVAQFLFMKYLHIFFILLMKTV